MRKLKSIIGALAAAIGILIYGTATIVIDEVNGGSWAPGNTGDLTWGEWEISQMKLYPLIEKILPTYVQISRTAPNPNQLNYVKTKIMLFGYLYNKMVQGVWSICLGMLLFLWPRRNLPNIIHTPNKAFQAIGDKSPQPER